MIHNIMIFEWQDRRRKRLSPSRLNQDIGGKLEFIPAVCFRVEMDQHRIGEELALRDIKRTLRHGIASALGRSAFGPCRQMKTSSCEGGQKRR